MNEKSVIFFIRLRRRPRALPVDVRPRRPPAGRAGISLWRKCEKVFASADVRRVGKAQKNLEADNPAKLQRENIGAKQGMSERPHGLCPWGSIDSRRKALGSALIDVFKGGAIAILVSDVFLKLGLVSGTPRLNGSTSLTIPSEKRGTKNARNDTSAKVLKK